MSTTTHSLLVTDLIRLLVRSERGVIYLVGDNGGQALITGEIYASNLVAGCTVIETEHGSLYVDADEPLTVCEQSRSTSGQLASDDLYALNTQVTELLAHQFGWSATTDADDDALNDLVLSLGSEIHTLITATHESGHHS